MNDYTSISKFYNKKNKKKQEISDGSNKKQFKFIYVFITKVLLCLIIFVSALIIFKVKPNLKDSTYNLVYEHNFSFAKVNEFYKKYFGSVLPFENIVPDDTRQVFNEKIVYNNSNLYKEGVHLEVAENYLIPVIESGIIVFIGDKEDYGKTVIVQQIDGVDVWYGNVEIKDLKLYDYVVKGTLLAEVDGKELYLVFQKEGKYLDYKDYL